MNCVTLDTFHIYYSNNGKKIKKELKYLFICQLFFQLNRKFYLSLCDVDSFCFHFFFFLVIICICYDTTLLATQHIYIRNPHSGKVSNKTKICKDRSWYALKLNSGDKGVQLRNCYDQILHVFFQGFRSNGPIVTPLPMSLPPFTLTF